MLKYFINLDNNIEKEVIEGIKQYGALWNRDETYVVGVGQNTFDLLVQDLGEYADEGDQVILLRWGFNKIEVVREEGVSGGEINIRRCACLSKQ